MTRRVEVTFTVKEYTSGKPFIVMEPLGFWNAMPEINRKVVGVDLADGTSYEEAEALAKQMRQTITHFTITD